MHYRHTQHERSVEMKLHTYQLPGTRPELLLLSFCKSSQKPLFRNLVNTQSHAKLHSAYRPENHNTRFKNCQSRSTAALCDCMLRLYFTLFHNDIDNSSWNINLFDNISSQLILDYFFSCCNSSILITISCDRNSTLCLSVNLNRNLDFIIFH